MSESSSYGESGYSSSGWNVSKGESSYSPTPAPVPQKPTLNIEELKTKLKSIEASVSKDLTKEEKHTFIKVFRQIIVDNEDQVLKFPTAGFFISKFESYEDNLLSAELKSKILNNLKIKQTEEKQNNSKLKYW